MFRRIPAVVLVITALLLLAAGGCGGGSSDSEEEPAVRASALTEIREDYEFNFEGTYWHTPPETLEIEGTTLVAQTDFYPDDEGRDLAKQLCNALNANYVLATSADYGLDGVAVYVQGDALFASASGGGTC